MHQLSVALAVIGILLAVLGAFSRRLKRSLIQEPVIAVTVGIAAGPFALDWLDVADWGDETMVLEQAARFTLAIGLMGVALRLKRESVARLWRPAALLLTLGMAGMWLVSSALAGWLLGLGPAMALLVGAVVTPTDPVVASSIVTGPFAESHLPRRLRDVISLESGANDGLAYAFVMLPTLWLGSVLPQEALRRWLVETLLVGVGLAVVVGCAVGYGAALLLKRATRDRSAENQSMLGYTVAFSLATLGLADLLRTDALIAVFLAGLAFNLVTDRREEHEEENIQEAVAKLFTLPMFVIFGIALPFDAWLELGWPLAAFAGTVLLLRRPPVLALLAPGLRTGMNRSDVAFAAWFGPIGIAAIYYAAVVTERLQDPLVWPVTSAVVFTSILVHGVTAAPLTRLHARHPGRAPEATAPIEPGGEGSGRQRRS